MDNKPDGAEVSPELAAVAARVEAETAAPAGTSSEPGAAPAAEAPPPGGDRLTAEDAARFARLGLDWVVAAAIKQYPELDTPPIFTEATRERGALLAGAVIAKRDLPGFLAKWKEELQLGMFLAGVAWESYQRVQASARAAPKPDAAAEAPAT